ncbi:GNAT family N-acetyltransferase [Planctomicrobium sp. SH664]|uniref:GNAT family N-acetyltransferase n=1 Tax=Planctomicrobium sp. SH664 TaxID=3448125 RepID=UPI003F5B4042
MLNDWFAELKFELPWETFRGLPRHPAYRYEYRAGTVSIRGNPRYYHALLDLQCLPKQPAGLRESFGPLSFRSVTEQDWPPLRLLFAAAFEDHVPFQQADSHRLEQAASRLLQRLRSGEDGPLVSAASIVALKPDGTVAGASLITLVPAGDLTDFTHEEWGSPAPPDAEKQCWGRPHLTWIFVAPHCRRQGVASALLRQSAEGLRTAGYSTLASTLLLGDHTSLLWHWKQGFRLLSYPGR